ncbi:MAG TPA: hypothetical protein VN176_09585 [Verrucomicrobiae bacterium]|nr:hypothetical protein [Verrucomicrobiae bacterium]
MKRTFWKSVLVGLCILVMAGLMSAQTTVPLVAGGVKTFTQINPPPCDFSDQFYRDNGIDPTQLVLRFGDNGGQTRLTGPPATGSQVNYVADTHCSSNDPTRRNFRILATTGGNADDGNSPFTTGTQETVEFISILAFLTNQTNFETSYSRTVGAITNGGLDGDQSNAGTTISITPGTDPSGNQTGLNPRGISMEQIVSNFEAYAAVKQFTPQGFAGNPCNADMQSPDAPATPCFHLDSVNTVFTPNLRQDWRFATNRNAMDGSDNNCINTGTNPDGSPVCGAGISDSPFGYFCDDLLGMWIITYFWFTQPPNTTMQPCHDIFKAIGAKNGFNLDGTPIILTAFELNQELEANHCGAEGKEAVNGADGGAVWLICPAIADPRNGGIAKDAFLDVVRLANGNAQDPVVLNAFSCLQNTGKFCNESAPEQ